jgi:hypothetical protein
MPEKMDKSMPMRINLPDSRISMQSQRNSWWKNAHKCAIMLLGRNAPLASRELSLSKHPIRCWRLFRDKTAPHPDPLHREFLPFPNG